MANNSSTFNAYSRYYDLLYRDKDYQGEVSYIHSTLTKFGVTSGDILEFGSGTGKHGSLLAGMGFNVHGIERSPEMVARACAAPGFSCEQGDICTVRMGRTYAAVLSLFHVISYLTSNERVQAAFARAAEHLDSGGLFVFDFWYSPAVYTLQPATRVKRMTDGEMEITRIAEPCLYPNENRVDVHYTIFARNISDGSVQTIGETHPMRHFSLPEIDLLSTSAGFTRICAEEFLTSGAASGTTWSVCAILKKR